jgi:hypothetical protein
MGATAWSRGDPVEVAPAFLDAVGAAVCAGVLQLAPKVSGPVTVRGVQRSRGTASLLASLESSGRAGCWVVVAEAPSTFDGLPRSSVCLTSRRLSRAVAGRGARCDCTRARVRAARGSRWRASRLPARKQARTVLTRWLTAPDVMRPAACPCAPGVVSAGCPAPVFRRDGDFAPPALDSECPRGDSLVGRCLWRRKLRYMQLEQRFGHRAQPGPPEEFSPSPRRPIQGGDRRPPAIQNIRPKIPEIVFGRPPRRGDRP